MYVCYCLDLTSSNSCLNLTSSNSCTFILSIPLWAVSNFCNSTLKMRKELSKR